MKVRNTTAKITSKGQITIPKEVRDELEVSPGDSLHFRVEDGSAVMTPVRRRKLTDFVGIFADDNNPAVKHVRELAAQYSGQELVKKIKEFERQGVSRYLAEKHRR